MKRKKLRVMLIFSSVLLISVVAILFLNRGKQENQETIEPSVVKDDGERWIQIVRTSESEPSDLYLYDNGVLSGWLEVKLTVEKEGLYIATYMGKIHRNRLDF
ncbi:hypothetical protein I6N95_14015 [Vagococcus sp. BWB3-3]|uniref:Uncharacterized protein n=1 Tax=Vagococcus allomyrinae TaxID=2794353 RepID=A0A940SWH4_9ENTE|nr:hypothetical protein [Vagococcus allomyrinae]MBP1042131.1 hypothetical protein [Vagococcus allomyrinae]